MFKLDSVKTEESEKEKKTFVGSQKNQEVQVVFKKGRGTRDQIANICWIIEKAREFHKNSISALLTMPKSLTVWITTNWKILKDTRPPDLPLEKPVCR